MKAGMALTSSAVGICVLTCRMEVVMSPGVTKATRYVGPT